MNITVCLDEELHYNSLRISEHEKANFITSSFVNFTFSR